MRFFELILNDPIVIYSFVGLLLLLGIGGFYVYYFLKNISDDK